MKACVPSTFKNLLTYLLTYLFIYLAASGLSCGMWNLLSQCTVSLLWCEGFSLVVARGL